MIVSHNELVAAVNKAFLGMRRHCGEADVIANMAFLVHGRPLRQLLLKPMLNWLGYSVIRPRWKKS